MSCWRQVATTLSIRSTNRLPGSLSVRCRPLDRLTLSVDGALERERYHVALAGVEHAAVAYSAAKVGAGVTLDWSSALHTRIFGGAAIRRRFERSAGDRDLGDIDVANGPFGGVEIWLGPSGW